MVAELLTFFAGPAVGSLIGGALGYLNRKHDVELKRIDVQQEQAKWAHQKEMRAVDLEQMKIEAEGKLAIASKEADASVEVALAAARTRAMESDSVDAAQLKSAGAFGRFMLVLVMVLQKIIRPGATIVLLGSALWLNSELIMMLRGQGWSELEIADRLALGKDAILWTMTQAGGALSYWFVSRGTGK